jgi:hypothetical protein
VVAGILIRRHQKGNDPVITVCSQGFRLQLSRKIWTNLVCLAGQSDVPLFGGWTLERLMDFAGAVENFMFCLEQDRFSTWEAVACEEQGIR